VTTVLHTGDTHVGYRQYHEPRRRADFLRAFEAVVEDAIEQDVDAVVHAGDLFHDRRPDLQDIQGVVAALRELQAANIPFLAIVGNHEAKRSGQWLDLFADIDLAERLGSDPRHVGDLALYGLDHVPESQRADLDYDFADHDAARSALVAHGLFAPFDPAEWDTEILLERADAEFDALLLGDNHQPGIEQLGDTWVTYPGSTERASASERADRGYNVVRLDDGDLRISRRTIDTRPFVFVDIELAAGEGAEVVRERVREYDHEAAVTIVTIEGEGEPIAPGPIEELATERGAIVARVNDRREHEDPEREIEVSFADPDEAVRRRLRELGLSTAARELDRVVRNEEIADSNVRSMARQRVASHREEGLAAFEPAPEGEMDEATAGAEAVDGEGADGEAEADASQTDDRIEDDGGPETASDAGPETEPTEDDEATVQPHPGDEGDSQGPSNAEDDADERDDGPEESGNDADERDDAENAGDDADAHDDDAEKPGDAASDGQASMEEYL